MSLENQRKILVVDDDPDLLALTSKLLTDHGYMVDLAYNGAQAKFKIENESFDLIISDIHMPLLNGIEFIKVVKYRSTKFTETPVIAISGHLSKELKLSLSNAGITMIYEKPVDYKALLAQIAQIFAEQKHAAS